MAALSLIRVTISSRSAAAIPDGAGKSVRLSEVRRGLVPGPAPQKQKRAQSSPTQPNKPNPPK